jgi:hypothetical protein
MFNWKGTIEIYNSKGELERVYHNRFVYSGRAMALEALFPVDNGTSLWWMDEIDGRTAGTHGDPYKRYFDVGTSTDANGVTGPTTSVGVLKTTWNGPSIFDFKLGTPLFSAQRKEVTVKQRNSRTVEMEMVVNQTDITGNYIYEIGIFAGMNLSYPLRNPDQSLWDANDRLNAMIARAIFYKEDPGDSTKWLADPIYIANSDTKTIRYTMQDV